MLAPEELITKFTDYGFKKMWINKEYQKFQQMVNFCCFNIEFVKRLLFSLKGLFPRPTTPYRQNCLSKKLVATIRKAKSFNFCLMEMRMEKYNFMKFFKPMLLWKQMVSERKVVTP